MSYWKILCLLLAATVLFLTFYCSHKIKKMSEYQNAVSEHAMNLSLKEEFYHHNFELEALMTNEKAPDIQCMEYKHKELYLSDMVKEKPLLIYRYTELNCNTCYEAELSALQGMFADRSEQVAVFCSYRVERDFSIFKKMNRIKLPLYRIPSDAFKWKAEEYNNPYYFVLHPDMTISHIYVPNKQYPDLNRLYLEKIKRLLYN